MRYIKLFIDVVILGVIFVFFAENYEVLQQEIQLKISFFFSKAYLFPPIHLYMLLLLVFALAVFIVLLIMGKEVLFLHFAKRKLERTVKEQETELVQLRTLPLKENTVSKPSTSEVENISDPQ